MPRGNKWNRARQQAQQATQQTQQQAQPQPQQVATQQASVPLNTVNGLGYSDNAWANVGETKDLIEAYFTDFGLTNKLDLDEIENHFAMVDDHEQRISTLETEMQELKRQQAQQQAAAPQAQATQQAAAQATPQAQAPAQQQVVTQQAATVPQAQQTLQQLGITIEELYCSGNVACYKQAHVKQSDPDYKEEPEELCCFVNSRTKKASPLTPGQMQVFEYALSVTH